MVIVAGLILFTGLAGVTTMGMMGTSTMKSGLDKLDLLGLFSGGNSGGGEVETPVENNEPVAGYPEGLEILPGSINAEGDFTFE